MPIKKGLTGGYHLSYPCPHCEENLRNDIGDVGKEDVCPSCGRAYTVPGQNEVAELERRLDSEKKAKQEAHVEACADKARQETNKRKYREEAARNAVETAVGIVQVMWSTWACFRGMNGGETDERQQTANQPGRASPQRRLAEADARSVGRFGTED